MPITRVTIVRLSLLVPASPSQVMSRRRSIWRACRPLTQSVAKTDLRAFLGKGVPAELTVAALRRGWSADPAIRDFIGLSENSWDFNDPGGIPGFGTLEPEEIQRLLARLTGADETNEVAAPASAAPLSSEQATSQPTECDAGSELPQDISDNDMDSHSAQNIPQDPDLTQIAPAGGVDAVTSTDSAPSRRGCSDAFSPERSRRRTAPLRRNLVSMYEWQSCRRRFHFQSVDDLISGQTICAFSSYSLDDDTRRGLAGSSR